MVVHAGVWAKLWDGSCPYMGHAHAAADAPTWVPAGTTSAATTATTSSDRHPPLRLHAPAVAVGTHARARVDQRDGMGEEVRRVARGQCRQPQRDRRGVDVDLDGTTIARAVVPLRRRVVLAEVEVVVGTH